MSVTVYRDANYQGPFARVRPGFFTGRDLRGFRNQSAYGSGEDLDNAISSARVGPNTIVALYGGTAPSASSGARVLVGPYEVPDLGALGMDDKVSALQVLSYKGYDSGVPRSGGAVLYSGYEGQGKHSVLEQGDYNSARLASEEVKFPDGQLRSLRVSADVIAILYDGPDFDTSMDAVVVVGPTMVGDLDRVGLLDRVSSIRVMYTDPRDRPHAVTPLGRPSPHFADSDAGYIPGRGAGAPAGYRPAARRSARAPARQAPPAVSPTQAPSAQTPTPPRLFSDPAKDRRRMWVVIVVLFVVVMVLAAYVVATSRGGKTGGGESSPPPWAIPL